MRIHSAVHGHSGITIAGDKCTDGPRISFLVKQGCSTRKQMLSEEVAACVTVKGIKSFRPGRHQWPHPTGVIGAGYNGLKTAMLYTKAGNDNYVVFDRNDKVGGYCWITAANKHSKLQTEFGSFHICGFARQFDFSMKQDLVTDKCPYPKGWEIWPKKKEVLAHFQHAAEAYGVLPNFRFKTNVAKMDIVGEKEDHDRYYRLTVAPVDGGDSTEVSVSSLYNYPGCMTRSGTDPGLRQLSRQQPACCESVGNRIIDYPGEDEFGGHVAYGMNDDCPYEELKGNNVAILGNGAFAVENARTCSEHAANKAWTVEAGALPLSNCDILPDSFGLGPNKAVGCAVSPSPGRRAGMELKVEAVEGFSLPNNCFIGVRVGDVLKQGRYEPHRCYHFPQLERRRNAKVDIYQHVGTCIVAVDPDTKSSHDSRQERLEVAVTSMDPSLPGSRIRVNVEAKMEDGKANREERAKALKVQARDYLTKHNIEEAWLNSVRLSEAVKALLKEQPADPTSFLCTHLRGAEAEAAKEPLSAPAPAEPQEPDDELNAIRKQGRDAFLQASEDGSLEQALRGLRPGLSEPSAEAASHEPTEEEKKKAQKDAVRMKASNVLIAAAENGELERALTLVKKDHGPTPACTSQASCSPSPDDLLIQS
eukprot:s485_g37.t1